jgi:hypothetical protein
VLLTIGFLVERGRSYYALPADALTVAAGAVAVQRRPRLLLVVAAVQLAVCIVAVPIVVPVLPERSAVSSGIVKLGFLKDEIGWPELAHQVEHAWRPTDEVVLAENYGEASALARYTRLPVLSGHLSWQYWRPRRLPQTRALLVGFEGVSDLCTKATVVARIDNRYHLDNEERGRTIVRCTLRRPLGELWPRIARTIL